MAAAADRTALAARASREEITFTPRDVMMHDDAAGADVTAADCCVVVAGGSAQVTEDASLGHRAEEALNSDVHAEEENTDVEDREQAQVLHFLF